MMKLNSVFLLAVLAVFTACNNSDELLLSDAALEIKGIDAVIDSHRQVTRTVDELKVNVGRTSFVANDHIVFTTIKRTDSALEPFTYSNIQYDCSDDKSWNRTEGNTPEKIYWTDGVSPHTFIGYSLPYKDYLWTDNGNGTFAGELGYDKSTIDFSSGNEEIQKEDLLLDYNTNAVAETGGLSTKVSFSHALSNVRVVVNIKNFAAGVSALDTKTVVSDMVLHNQPTKFTWGANSNNLNVLVFDENTTKDIALWCPVPEGEGEGQSKTFTFYGLTTPQDATFHQINGNNKNLEFSFNVTYPDAMDTSKTVTKTYKSSFDKLVDFSSGKCTTLNISLNHKGEQMQIDVEYSDWNYVATPDIGELRKKSTFMDIDSEVTTHDMTKATEYDATWLYDAGSGVIKDVYGNDGSESKPYRISTASQLLSFAKEVKGGFSFNGLFIRLDADITMQTSTTKTKEEGNDSGKDAVKWIGIGDDTHPFLGTFLGGDRYINRLYGNPLFVNIGEGAYVEQIYLSPIGTIDGSGALADTNAGIIGACKVIDDVTTNGGALVGTNNGTVYACYYTGTTGATSLVGSNYTDGKTVGCYVANDYSTITKTDVGALNNELDALYNQNTSLTPFEYVYSVGCYPTVKKK